MPRRYKCTGCGVWNNLGANPFKKMNRVRPLSKQSVEQKECDELWARAVKLRAGMKSEYSAKKEMLQAHHLIGKPNAMLRYSLENGYCATQNEHLFGFHSNSARFDFEAAVKLQRGADIYERLSLKRYLRIKPDWAAIKMMLNQELEKWAMQSR